MSDLSYDGAMADLMLREASYETPDGRHVWYDDGRDSLRDAADLYAVLPEHDETTGSPNLENLQARHILDRLQTGQGLGEAHVNTFLGLMKKHKDAIAELRRSPDRRGQDVLAVNAGIDQRVSETERPAGRPLRAESGEFTKLRRLTESATEVAMDDELSRVLDELEHAARGLSPGAQRGALLDAVVRVRERAQGVGDRGGFLARCGIPQENIDEMLGATPDPAAPVLDALADGFARGGERESKQRTMPLRESVLMGETSLLEAVLGGQLDRTDDGGRAVREANLAAGGGLLSRMGIDPADVAD